MKNKQIPLEERQKNIHEAIDDISRSDNPTNIKWVLAWALSFWDQKMNTRYMYKYPHMDDIHLVMLYAKHLSKEMIQKMCRKVGNEIRATLAGIDVDLLRKEYNNELLDIFVPQLEKKVA